MRENLATIFFILILLFAGFGVYYYHKNSPSPVNLASSYAGFPSSNLLNMEVYGFNGKEFLAVQVGNRYYNITVYIKISIRFEGPQPFDISITSYGSDVWIYTHDFRINSTFSYGNISTSAYDNQPIKIFERPLTATYAFIRGYRNGDIFNYTVTLIDPPDISITVTDKVGNTVVLKNTKPCSNLGYITLTLKLVEDASGRWLEVLGVYSTQGWCEA